ncbi:MAG: polysaccharide deacetylase family protein, partial [Planctomycetes bacterium]|nr:polysaccharide deacetylase family protein [Planctomycetota bacterium]
MRIVPLTCVVTALFCAPAVAERPDGNRLAYLDSSDPYYVSRNFPKLTTPQWVGEPGVEAVVVLAIDDMRGHEKWEAYLRPILERLKRIDGRAAVSIMTCQIDPQDPHLQTWLKEGVSLETHSYDHPCPILKDGDFAKAKGTFDRCVDLLNAVPGNRPVAFRVPCCDSRNTPSPRFYAEIFNSKSPAGRFLTIDSSVFNIITADDPELPRELALDASGEERFRRYVPFESFVNTIEDYPYPYPIGRQCWEFPCVVPSDWSAQNLQQPFNPRTVTDLAAALDAAVIKQGVFNLVFHPHGWIRNDQVVQLIEHAVERHGPKVKFLTFREAQERLDRHLLGGHPLRATGGGDNGVRLIDLNNDGYQDVVIGNNSTRQTRLWDPHAKAWITGDFPVRLDGPDVGDCFGVLHGDGRAVLIVRNEQSAGGWHLDGRKWVEDQSLLAGLEVDGQKLFTAKAGVDRGVRLIDIDHDGRTELLVANESQRAIFGWSATDHRWQRLPFDLPTGAAFVDSSGRDQGLRLVDVDGDLALDVVFSNEREYAFCLFKSMQDGWSQPVLAGKRPEKNKIPMISRNGTNNGAWFHSGHLWVQNEDTARMKDLVDRRSFDDLLKGVEPGPRSPEAGLKSMRAKPGFAVELVAAEPLVMDPVAFDWGPDGKLWVVEMADYPLGMDGRGKFGGRVRYLEDTDGDGKYDRSTLFLDGLGYPDGVIAWRAGVLVSCAPEILYAADTDGDGRADRREPLYIGFGEGNQQHRMNGFWSGLDNWLYCANGNSGGEVQSLRTGEKLKIGRRDFRIRPETGAIQPQTGETQFGRATDDWGNWFGCSNSNPAYHFALDDVYLLRNIHFAPPDARVSISTMPGAAPVFPISRTLARFNDYNAANRFTSACGLTIYRDELLGPEFTGNTFVSEPVHNLVHREIVTASGATFTSRRSADEARSEFL